MRAEGRKPTVDPDTYCPLSSPQFVHPALVVWRWKAGLYGDLKSAVEDYLFHSVISRARNGGKCCVSCRHIAEKLGLKTGEPDGGQDSTANAGAVWGCVRFSRLLFRSGARGGRGRAWNIRGLLEWDEPAGRYILVGAGLRSNRSNTPIQSERDSDPIGVKLRSHNSEVCVEEGIESLSEVGMHPGNTAPSFTPHHTRQDAGGDGSPRGSCPSRGIPFPDGVSRSPVPPVPQPPPSREERREERRERELDDEMDAEAHWDAMDAVATRRGGRMYAYKPLDGTVAVEAAGLAGVRGDIEGFRTLYGRYLDRLGEEGKPLTRENCSAKAFKTWVELDMEEEDIKAVALAPRQPTRQFPEWIPLPDDDEYRSDATGMLQMFACFIVGRGLVEMTLATYGAVVPGELLRWIHGDDEAERIVAAAVAGFDEKRRKEFAQSGAFEPGEGLEGCLFADWRQRFGITEDVGYKSPPTSDMRRNATEALSIIRGWPPRNTVEASLPDGRISEPTAGQPAVREPKVKAASLFGG